MGREQHMVHGDPRRFEVLADYIAARYENSVRYIADVAGGQGLLSRRLAKHGYESEVVDPRGWVRRGVDSRSEAFDSTMADYYDLIVGLHPDGATRAVAQAAVVRPAILIPCCNFWTDERLGRDELLDAIEESYRASGVRFERVTFDFRGPKNVGIVSEPPAGADAP